MGQLVKTPPARSYAVCGPIRRWSGGGDITMGYGNDSFILGPQGHVPMLYAPQEARINRRHAPLWADPQGDVVFCKAVANTQTVFG